ncbi:MAG TPA: hypothetical protein VES67_04165 [Vicinamibacterales bacterium]|nr:hypothetical protein [Vicinamibacterales bacterium]
MTATHRRPQQRWLDAAARRAAARAAFYARADHLVQADLARLDRLLMVQSRYHFARTMPDNPHSYTLRRQWLWPGGDDDFCWVVATMRIIADREKFPPGPGGRFYEILHRAGPTGDILKYWPMGWYGNGGPITLTNGKFGIFLINRKPVLSEDE